MVCGVGVRTFLVLLCGLAVPPPGDRSLSRLLYPFVALASFRSLAFLPLLRGSSKRSRFSHFGSRGRELCGSFLRGPSA
eukprot:152364-Prorocentrum_lima.AAC.1